jgi:hypothetical protein
MGAVPSSNTAISQVDAACAAWLRDCNGEGPLEIADVTDVCASMHVEATLRDAGERVVGHVDADGSCRIVAPLSYVPSGSIKKERGAAMSSRIVLTDGTGRYFDGAKAQSWDEATRWNGNNHISRATGSQWEHERLYRTPAGIYVLHHWSQWQGSTESYEQISADEAAAWLSRNEHTISDASEAGVADEFRALEIA